jgi:Fe-S-cluster containining protein
LKLPKENEIHFQCQQSGHCCCDPNIIVTLTFMDVYDLFLAVNKDFESLIRKLTFYKFTKGVNEDQRKKLVLPAISTSVGEIIPGIKKINGLNCVFYSKPNCSIYHNRPLACKNYPFTFLGKDNKRLFSWAKNAEKTCPGIGEGNIVETSYIERNGSITSEYLNMHTDFIQELNIEAVNSKTLSAREVIWIFIVYGEKIKKKE